MKINIKPLSVNKAWQGRRFKTDEYKAFNKEMMLKLKPITIPDGPLCVSFTFGFSNRASDIDNPLKPVIDILQKKYGFNDNRIYELNVVKEVVKKGKEFIHFNIEKAR
jgi:Holliday junction resolvase RusA-like endonuclease